MDHGLPSIYTIGPLPHILLGSLSLPTYYLVISFTCSLCVYWFYKRCELRNLSIRNAMDICLIALVGGFVGARLAHVFFEYPTFYLENPKQIFYFWQGGFVFYGGAIFAYICAFLYARKLKLTFWLWHDTAAPVMALGYALGRVACFLEGCCYGKLCDLPWAIPLKEVNVVTDQVATHLRHPTQLYAVGTETLTLLFLVWLERRHPKLGVVFLTWVILHSSGRIIMETFRDDPRGPDYFSLPISTIVSIVFILMALVALAIRLRPSSKP